MDALLGRAHPAERVVTVAHGLSVRQVTRIFDGHAGISDVSFNVGHGELVALVGASGSGKTTSLRVVAGYESPDQGHVLFDGVDVTQLPPDKRGFGTVFQHYALFPHMSVVENVAFGLEARGVPKTARLKQAEEALAGVGLSGKGSRRVQQLSGGEQQRVALARAIVIEPRLLLLDEPLSNLDLALRESMRAELRGMLRRVGAPTLFVTHDQEDAFAVADRVVLLANGRILQIGTPETLYHHPVSRDVATFIGRSTLLPADDHGNRATVTVNGVSRTLEVSRPDRNGATAERLSDARVVLRPEALSLASPDARDAWPGTVLESRFAGAMWVYHVALSDTVTVGISSTDRVAVGARVGIAVRRQPVPLVP
jgi:ABC-type Fe3+/spermidine/putrescine transport system ATPase subunit